MFVKGSQIRASKWANASRLADARHHPQISRTRRFLFGACGGGQISPERNRLNNFHNASAPSTRYPVDSAEAIFSSAINPESSG